MKTREIYLRDGSVLTGEFEIFVDTMGRPVFIKGKVTPQDPAPSVFPMEAILRWIEAE